MVNFLLITVVLYQEADKDKLGYLDFEGFRRFVRLIKRRPDLERIYNSLGKLDLATFSKFLLETQKVHDLLALSCNCR